MQNEIHRRDFFHAPPGVGIVMSLLFVLPRFVLIGSLRAADLQASTDRATPDTKKELRIALNRDLDSSPLTERFFEFYEGKIVSANQLHPETYHTGQIGPPASVQGGTSAGAKRNARLNRLHDCQTQGVFDSGCSRSMTMCQTLLLDTFVAVRGTKSYETVAGSTNTVDVLEPAKGKLRAVNPVGSTLDTIEKYEVIGTGEFTIIRGPKAVFSGEAQEVSVTFTQFTRGDRNLMWMIVDRYSPTMSPDKADETPQQKAPEKSAQQPVGID